MTDASGSSSEDLESKARALRQHHRLNPDPPDALPAWAQLDEIPDWLKKARQACHDPPEEAGKAAEWFLDNEYHIRRAVRQVRNDMPPAFYRRLPRLSSLQGDGYPRILAVARGFLDATVAQPAALTAAEYVEAYQGKDGLTLAELWAFPAMLRLVCIETVVLSFSELAPDLEAPFESLRRRESAQLKEATEALSRAIIALGSIERIDWKTFVERVSHIEAILRKAPDALYAQMDFETRDRYRTAIQDLAEGAGRPEVSVAEKVVRTAARFGTTSRESHVGYWLIDEGRREFEKGIGYRPRRRDLLVRAILDRPGRFYTTAVFVLATLALLVPLGLLRSHGAGLLATAAFGILLVIPASIVSLTISNWLFTLVLPPRVLPKMDFAKGLPESLTSVVISPVILRDSDEAASILSQIERQWLTNQDARLRFAVLTDLADASARTCAGDAALETALIEGIRQLNRRHAQNRPFVLLHRRRVWNEAEGIWMGWERKRGKIEQFVGLLHGENTDAFAVTEGDVQSLTGTRLVVTLDADTNAPPGSIHKLLGTLAHPLNRAVFDTAGDRVVGGYTFIQPRIEISPEAGGRSLFTRLYTGDTAIDIYSCAVSDLYQDLFGRGIFTGKGAFDASAFRNSLSGRVPENALASHDLFEGLHGRVALASDIVFYEGFPSRYPDFARRLHRWIRGDWQLTPWLWHHVPGRGGTRLRNRLSLLDRWKIIDNLRRSVIAPTLVLLAVLGWVLMPGLAWLWTLFIIAAPGTYLVTHVVSGMSRGRRRGTVQQRWRQFSDHAGRWLLEVVFMANEAIVSMDAICRTLWRLAVTRRHLLEWVTAAHSAASGTDERNSYWVEMAAAPILSLAVTGLLSLIAPAALPGAAPLLLLWMASPEIARWIGRPHEKRRLALSAGDRSYLRRLARCTWLYFETFAGPEDNWLAPDNFQISPAPEVAHRTSPTNIGMQLVSSLTALELGHGGLRDIAARSHEVLASLDRVQNYRGHILNWFDTRTLDALEPRYISTVDSGNLAVSLITLHEGLLEALSKPVMSPALWDGLIDTLDLLSQSLAVLPPKASAALASRIEGMIAQAQSAKTKPDKWRAVMLRLRDGDLHDLSEALVETLTAHPEADPAEIHIWLERCQHHVASYVRDLDALCPWFAVCESEPAICEKLGLQPDMSLAQAQETADEALRKLPGLEVRSDQVDALKQAISMGRHALASLLRDLQTSAEKAEAFALGMDFTFLYDKETRTFLIGYNLSLDQIDAHRYDLIASEARLASYFAIAKGDVPAEHWFHLGRPISRDSGALTVLSWNGSMFEFLMPALFIRSAPGQLLGQSEAAAVDIQIRYGRKLGLPWGVSEAAFSARDAAQRYQYQAFGVPGLGMRQGLAEDYVVAPYASALALSQRPVEVLVNLRRLGAMGGRGRYGFFDSIDFTPGREQASENHVPVQAFMAHHQGMLLSAIGNLLCDDMLVRLFNRNRRMSAIDLLLHERVPWEFVPEPLPDAGAVLAKEERRAVPALHGWQPAPLSEPQFHTLGNGRLSLWLSAMATGSLRWQGQAITRHPSDPVCAEGLSRLLLCDTRSGATWDFADQPDRRVDVVFHAEKASFHVHHDGIAATQEICVSAADDLEIRRVTLVNQTDTDREIEVTSYAEPVLDAPLAYERHPAFSKMFIKSTFASDLQGLFFQRRPRRPGEEAPMLLHRFISDDPDVAFAGFESDRREVLGRHGTLNSISSGDLDGSDGWTLDPVVSLRARARLAPGQRVDCAFLTFIACSRATLLETAGRFSSSAALDWALGDTARHAAGEAFRMTATQDILMAAQKLAGLLLSTVHRPGSLDEAPLPAQRDLWGLGLSGDLPIVLVCVRDAERSHLLPDILAAYRWLRRGGLIFDLVILGTVASSYEAQVAARLREALREVGLDGHLGGNGGVHLHSTDSIAPVQRRALEQMARLTLDGTARKLEDALPTRPTRHPRPPLFEPVAPPARDQPVALAGPADLSFDNGTGGFSPETGDYLIRLRQGETTPVPWCNVLANDGFGTIVSEAGLGFTWSLNSGEFRLTPWSNDPVSDTQGEAIYLRDEETAEVWTVTQLPAGDAGPCLVRHGRGETVWQRASKGLLQSLEVFIPPDAPVKIARLRVENRTERSRRVTATYLATWQLGALPSTARPHVRCGYHVGAQALIARNGWATEFSQQIAFLTASRPPHAMTCDRRAFLGPGGMRQPEGLRRWQPEGGTDSVEDPCACYQVHLDLAAGADEEVVFVLGCANDLSRLEELAMRYRDHVQVQRSQQLTTDTWQGRLDAVQVKTPDPAFDLLINRWLPNQSFASRVQARAGFQQAGGAFGFRDQLQDMMAFLLSEPKRVRAHIIECARRQFEEGDVLHWWHPPEGRGVRTRCSDDMLWLVYATHAYVMATGDVAILREKVPFLSADPLAEEEEDRYAIFEHGKTAEPLFEHCLRAMDRASATGRHGLPLIGSGDWNDGMDRVGYRGFGESVWLAWFAAYCAKALADLAVLEERESLAEYWRARAQDFHEAAETAGWDGAWYRRAFDDEGDPWGSGDNDECRIDSIAQSWAALSGAPDKARTAQAIGSAATHLIDREARLVRLLTPPFDKTPRDPGYIRSYPPGIRENGGQYTHAATWLGLAFVALGQGDLAYEIFEIINPIRRTSTRDDAQLYRGEPYVMPADVGGAMPFEGRAGWTWYTGAAGWAWRLGVEGILGLKLRKGALTVAPCLPRGWDGFEATIKGPAGAITVSVRREKDDAAPKSGEEKSREMQVSFPTDGTTRNVTMTVP